MSWNPYSASKSEKYRLNRAPPYVKPAEVESPAPAPTTTTSAASSAPQRLRLRRRACRRAHASVFPHHGAPPSFSVSSRRTAGCSRIPRRQIGKCHFDYLRFAFSGFSPPVLFILAVLPAPTSTHFFVTQLPPGAFCFFHSRPAALWKGGGAPTDAKSGQLSLPASRADDYSMEIRFGSGKAFASFFGTVSFRMPSSNFALISFSVTSSPT